MSISSGFTSLHLAHDADDGTIFGARSQRAGGAVSASLVGHAIFMLICYVLVTLPAPAPASMDAEKPRQLTGLVWLSVAGPGGGGGGGGNRSPEPPRKLETRGPDSLSVPVLKPSPLTPPKPKTPEAEPPQMALNVPIRQMDAGQIAAVGAVESALLPPTSSQGSGIGGGAGSGRGTGSGPGQGSGLGDGSIAGTGGGVFRTGNGVLAPQLLKEVKPEYTADAMRARIQGDVELAAIVREDGSVTDLRVVRSLDQTFGLDEQAIKAARQWRFKPATRFGTPVAVFVTIAVGFTMR